MTDQHPAAEPASAPNGERRGGVGPRLGRGIFAVLAVVALAAAVAVLLEVFLLRPRHAAMEAEAEARAGATRAAEQFAVQFNTYSSDDIDAYKQAMNRLLSTSGQTAFERTIGDVTDLVRSARLESEGEVLSSAVASIDIDSADVLVVVDARVDSVQGRVDRYFRWEVALVRVGGQWRVDDFTPVA